MGSSEEKMERCLGWREAGMSPFRRRTVPSAKPIAICPRLSSAANAEIWQDQKQREGGGRVQGREEREC